MARVATKPATSSASRPVVAGFLVIAALAALALVLPAAAQAVPFGPEPGRSPNADDTTTVYWVMFVLAVLIMVAVNLALIAGAARRRPGAGRHGRARLHT